MATLVLAIQDRIAVIITTKYCINSDICLKYGYMYMHRNPSSQLLPVTLVVNEELSLRVSIKLIVSVVLFFHVKSCPLSVLYLKLCLQGSYVQAMYYMLWHLS